MSLPSTHGNGCSLEDCHTNLFALTDLDGIKWLKLGAPESTCSEPLDDPVLQSYTKCIQADILCVWRKVQRSSSDQKPPDQLKSSKELWIFWYGDEPHRMKALLSNELTEQDKGSWTNGGLSYECRTLLFKALHNLIERCLLSHNFVRLGMWFVQPYDNGHKTTLTDKSTYFSIKFSFFLHGESQVCASVDVRQHTPMRLLQQYHLALASQGQHVQVILAPYGLSAVVTGQACKDSEPATHKLMDEWKQFFILKDRHYHHYHHGAGDQAMPSAVEVIVSGVRMKYPSCYVLVTAEQENDLIARNPQLVTPNLTTTNPPSGNLSVNPLTPPASPVSSDGIKIPPPPPHIGVFEPSIDVLSKNIVTERIAEKVWQDCCVSSATQVSRLQHQPTSEGSNSEENPAAIGNWDFAEPMQKNLCTCPKGKNKQRSGSSALPKPGTTNANKHPKDRPEKGDKPQSRHGRAASAFHRRSTLTDDILQGEADLMAPRISASYSAGFKTPIMQQQQQQTPTSSNNVSQPNNTSFNTEQSIDSPHSAAPSPLVATPIQHPIKQDADPTMPTLSPHPPPKTDSKITTNGAPNSIQGGENQDPNAMAGGDVFKDSTPTKMAELCNGDIKTEILSPGSVPPNNSATTAQPTATTPVPQPEIQVKQSPECRGLKRPVLPDQLYRDRDEELVTESFYDFDSFNDWFNDPIKRQRLECWPDGKQGHSGGGSHSRPNTPSSYSRMRSGEGSPSPQQPKPDPYEFSDESSADTLPMAGRRSIRHSRDDSYPRPSPFNKQEEEGRRNSDGSFVVKEEQKIGGHSLKYTQDLIATYGDLDQIFDTSESESSENDTFQPPLSPSSMKGTDEIKMANTKPDITGNLKCPTANDLSMMFPTPPSLENQHNASSPGIGTDVPHDQTVDTIIPRSDGIMDSIVTISLGDSVKDWSYVFKQPTLYMFVGSSSYDRIDLPVKTLPPELVYKSSWQQFPPLPSIQIEKQPTLTASNYLNVPSVDNPANSSRLTCERMTSVEASPATFPHSNQQRTPLSYDLQSPASNASSYLNKNLNSVDNQGTNMQLPEVSSLVVNVLLSDSLLNLFKDHNFDSCTICVCNMNIKGADAGQYIVDKSSELQYKCTCGFSAVMNRKLAPNSGLFYEDEVDITGIRSNHYDQRKPSLLAIEASKEGAGKDSLGGEIIPMEIFTLLQGQFSVLFPSSSVLSSYYKKRLQLQERMPHMNILEFQDGCEAIYSALEAGRQLMDNCSSQKLDESLIKDTCLHRWPLIQCSARVPTNTQDMMNLLNAIQPLLHDMRKQTMSFWASVYTVSGPLSWKDFHLLAGRGSDEASEPQPIPPLLVGHEKEWLSLSPFALKFWDKLMLESYSKQKDIGYIILAPDNDYILNHVRLFFREMSTLYELCRLGRHVPVSRDLRDGILRVGRKSASQVADQPVDEWFSLIENTPVTAKLKLYAQTCKHQLGPFLAAQNLDKGLFENTSTTPTGMRPAPKPEPSPAPPQTPESGSQGGSSGSSTPQHSSDDKNTNEESSQHTKEQEQEQPEQEEQEMPCVVVYIIDPFCFYQEWGDGHDINRLTQLGLLRCYNEMLQMLPDNLANNIQLQIIPLQSILEFKDTPNSQYLKSLCMSVFAQCRRQLTYGVSGRSLTGLGPAASTEALLKTIVNEPGHASVTKLYSPPFVLAQYKNKQMQLAESLGECSEKSNTLLCAYCLSEDQRWLMAVCTDSYGEILETCTVNIEIPNRNRRKKASARKIGLGKLWDFIIGVMSRSMASWRLVVGRFGRMGHGELQGWSGLLSRKNLLRGSKQMRDMCGLCGNLNTHDVPCILSACLISMEVHQSIHVMTDAVKLEEKMSGQASLSTPRDSSVTHILVFPMSSTAQESQAGNQQENHILDDDLSMAGGGGGNDFFAEFGDEFADLGDIFSSLSSGGSPGTSPKNLSAPNSPLAGGRHSPTPMDSKLGGGGGSVDPQDEKGNQLLMQPLAMGFYVSTAPTGPLPHWIFSSCPHMEKACPICFKAALHIHCPTVQQSQDQFPKSNQSRNSHPLDSNFTCDVLRYVLEMYNALSWLTVDPCTNDRRSCLPAHFVVLCQLYHALNAFV